MILEDDCRFAPVSVVIPCFHCGTTIERAVTSVAAQSMLPAEVILVDDCSNDGTAAVLCALRDRYPSGWIQVIELTINIGPGNARNSGWERATQPYVAFLDADDSWHPQKIEIQYRWMSEHPEAALTGHGCLLRSEESNGFIESTHVPTAITFRAVSTIDLLLSNKFPTRSVMLRRDLRHRFAPTKKYSEDFLLWCQICLDGYSCWRSDIPLAYLYKAEYGEGGLSGNLGKMQKGEIDVYLQLKKSKRIGWAAAGFLLAWSFIKYARRVAVTAYRNLNTGPKR